MGGVTHIGHIRQPEYYVIVAIASNNAKFRCLRSLSVGCGCDDADCEYSRIVDGYEFCCLTAVPPTHTIKKTQAPGYDVTKLLLDCFVNDQC